MNGKNKLLIIPIIIMLIAAGCAAKIKSEQTTTRPSVTTTRITTTAPTQLSTVTTTENYTVVTASKPLTTKPRTYKVTPSELPFDYERQLIASVVMNEAGYECYDGKVAVAQCILNACMQAQKKFSEVRWSYGYKYEKTPSQAVLQAVDDVFLNGVRVTDEPILYYYNPAYGYSSFHESQVYVMTIQHHSFFKRKGT